MTLEVVFAFVVGIAVTLLWRRARAIFADRNQPVPAPADATVPTQRIQQLSEPLTAIAESSAHPRDLLDNDSFREAVAILESDTVSLKLVTDYVGGANWPIATARSRIPNRDHSTERVLIMFSTAALAAPVCTIPGNPMCGETVMLTTFPDFCGMNALVAAA